MISADYRGIDAATYKTVRIQMRSNGANAASTIELFFTTNADPADMQAKAIADPAVTQAKAIVVPDMTEDAMYVEYVFDFSGMASWTGTIKQMRLDPVNASGTVDVNAIVVLK